jgi:hypothetical protein
MLPTIISKIAGTSNYQTNFSLSQKILRITPETIPVAFEAEITIIESKTRATAEMPCAANINQNPSHHFHCK